jgi:hypothetical protein
MRPGHSKLARIIIGTSFSWLDILAYTLGIGMVILIESFTTRRTQLIPENKAGISSITHF